VRISLKRKLGDPVRLQPVTKNQQRLSEQRRRADLSIQRGGGSEWNHGTLRFALL
jgi:hypothetical protein